MENTGGEAGPSHGGSGGGGGGGGGPGAGGGPRRLLREILQKNKEALKKEWKEKEVRAEMMSRKRKRPPNEGHADGDDEDVLMELDLVDTQTSSMSDNSLLSQRSSKIMEAISEEDRKLKQFLSMDFNAFKAQLIADSSHAEQVKSYLKIVIKGATKLEKISQKKCIERGIVIMQVLLDLASYKSKMPESVMKDLTKIGADCIKYFPTAVAYDIVMKVGYDFIVSNLNIGKFSGSWFNLYRKCMAKLFQGGNIEHDGDFISGQEIRLILVNRLCRLEWNKPLGPTIVKILMELPALYNDIHQELETIVDKFRTTVLEINEKELHEIMAHMIEGIAKYRAGALIKICDTFFKKGDYFQATEATTRLSAKAKEKFLGKIAYLFVDASRHCDPIQIELSKIAKAATFDHSLITSPFMTTVLMGLAGIDHLSAGIVEPLKTSLLRYTYDGILSEESKFYAQAIKSMTGYSQKPVTDHFEWTYIMKADLDLIQDGLEKLGIALLGVDNLQKKFPGTCREVKQLGVNLLMSVIIKNKESLGNMLKRLLRTDSPAHIGESFQGRIGEVIHHLPATNVAAASMIVKALMPAIQLSQVLLDELMIVLRKTFWKSVESGRICVEIMCVLMSSNKVVSSTDGFSNSGGLDEDDLLLTQASQSVSTRPAMDFSPICAEMLNLAKRCLEQDSPVREQVYLGLHRVARRNPGLCDLICGHLFSHASQYRYDESTLSFKPLFKFSTANSADVKLNDELGFLAQCLGFVFNKFHSSVKHNPDKPVSYMNCKQLLEEWIQFAITIQYERIEIIASSLLDNAGSGFPPEVAKYVRDVMVMQIKQMMEALIEFLALSNQWHDSQRLIVKLFKSHQSLEVKSKEQAAQKKPKQPAKKKPRKNQRKSDEAQADDNVSVASGTSSVNQTSVKIKQNPALKLEYFYLMNLDSVCQMLRELYKKDNRESTVHNMKGICEFENLLLETLRMKLRRLKTKASIRERERCPDDVFNAFTCIVETIWSRLIENVKQCKDNQSMTEDAGVIELRLEVLNLVLLHFQENRLKERIINFEDHRIKTDSDNSLSETAYFKTFENWISVLDMVERQFDAAAGFGSVNLFSMLNVWCKNVHSSLLHEKILSWVWGYLNNDSDKTGTEQLLVNIVEVFTSSYVKFSCYPEPRISSSHKKGPIKNPQTDDLIPFQFGIFKIAKALHTVLGDNDNERLTQRHRSWLITQEYAPKLYCFLTGFLSRQLELVSMTLGCMKSHHHYVGEETWSEKLREMCIQMIYYLRFIAAELISTAFPAGACGTEILKLCTQFYTVMTFLTEYYSEVIGNNNKNLSMKQFKQLLGEFGREFKPKIEALIQYVELVQRQRCEEAPGKAKVAKSQIAKDGKLIPNLVFHIEKFEQKLIILSKKVRTLYEVDLLTDMKLSTSRDFRIESAKLVEALKEKAAIAKKKGQKKKNAEVTTIDDVSTTL